MRFGIVFLSKTVKIHRKDDCTSAVIYDKKCMFWTVPVHSL